MTAESLESLDRVADEAMRLRQYGRAAEALRASAQLDPTDPSRWLKLAAAFRGANDLQGALAAVQQALSHAPRHFMALLMHATLLERAGSPETGEAYAVAVGLAPPEDRLDPSTRAALQRARAYHERNVAQRRASLLESGGAIDGRALSSSDHDRMTRFVDDHLRLKRRYHQEPSHFYFPGLPTYEFHDRELFPWIEDFEQATADIREELLGVIDEGFTGFTPYVEYPPHVPVDQWAELNHNPDWGAFHLIKGGQPVPGNASRCPRTMAAIARLPQPHINNRGPSAMFSALQPHTRIPPHTGVSNTRLVVHLPLIVPDSCGFRVGAETREWQPGVAWVFDDTVEHEAWNDSDRVRIILIVDVWSPFLTADQKAAIKAVMEATDVAGTGGGEPGL
jgi:aspartate beta-hydroxylase